jgi:hypothetical protein
MVHQLVDRVALMLETVAPVADVVCVSVGCDGVGEDPERLSRLVGVVLEFCLLQRPEKLRCRFPEALDHVFPHAVVHHLQPQELIKNANYMHGNEAKQGNMHRANVPGRSQTPCQPP